MTEEKLPAIQALWVGDELGEMERLSVASFLAHGHPYHLYVYSDVKNIPAGVQVMDANQILPAKEIYKAHSKGHAPFSDWFRWELLYQKGGYWMDTDVICLKKHDLSNEVILPKQDSGSFNIAIMRFPKGHPLTKAMVDRCRHPKMAAYHDSFIRPLGAKNLKGHGLKSIVIIPRFILLSKKRARIVLGAFLAGVDIMREFLESDARWQELYDDEVGELGRKYFYPVAWRDHATLVDDTYKDVRDPFTNSYSVHLWGEKQRKNKDNTALPLDASPGSFYTRQKKRYLSSSHD